MNEHRSLRVESGRPRFRERQRTFDDPLGPGPAAFDPSCGDELAQATRLLRTRKEPWISRHFPAEPQRAADDLYLGPDGEAKLGQRSTKPLQQHRLPSHIMTEQPHVPPAIRKQERLDLMSCCTVRQSEFENRHAAVAHSGFGDVGVRAAAKRCAGTEFPITL